MKIIELYTKYTLAKIAFVKKHKKVFTNVFYVCLALFVMVSLALIFSNYQILHTVSDSQAKADREGGQEQMDYKEAISEIRDGYSISMTIPKLKENDSASLAASQEMKAYFLNQVESFKNNFIKNKVREGASSVLSEQNFYNTETFSFVGKRFISFSIEEIMDSQYQADIEKHMIYFTYDKQLKKLITLSDIFLTNDAFYENLSGLVYDKLLPELDTVMFYNVGRHLNTEDKEKIKEALSYKENSFRLFMISDDEVLFSFDPFTFSSGTPFSEVYSARVPIDELKEFKK